MLNDGLIDLLSDIQNGLQKAYVKPRLSVPGSGICPVFFA